MKIESFHCKECGELRMNTPSGSVCPNGHGKLDERIPEGVLEAIKLPEASPAYSFKHIYMIDGLEGTYKRKIPDLADAFARIGFKSHSFRKHVTTATVRAASKSSKQENLTSTEGKNK